MVREFRNINAFVDVKLGGLFGMFILVRKYGIRFFGEWVWYVGFFGGVVGSRGRRSGRIYVTYFVRLGRRRSR